VFKNSTVPRPTQRCIQKMEIDIEAHMKNKHFIKNSLSSFCFCSEIDLRRNILSTNEKDLCSIAIEICLAITGECKGRKGQFKMEQ
jgi:hypothetical protein